MSALTLPQDVESDAEWNAVPFSTEGIWSEEDYLALDTNRLVEFVDGRIEVLPYPTLTHQLILGELISSLSDFAEAHNSGTAIMAPLPLKLRDGLFRTPDVMFLKDDRVRDIKEHYFDGADFVIEVVSRADPVRDYVTKVREYAEVGVSEYWIVDPRLGSITVLALDEQEYVEHGQFMLGEKAQSVLLPGFEVDVSAVFAAAEVDE